MVSKDWEIVIGIEIHLELNTKTKMFSPIKNDFLSKPNENVSNIDIAYPGSLPLLNKQAVIKAIKLAKALNMEIDQLVRFDRKNYFYPDLTKGFQITQQFHPIGKNGSIKIKVDKEWKDISIQRIHLEEDTAKSIHENNLTYLNYNRAGVPLIEIVSNPVMHSAKEAAAYVEAIRETALCLDISDAKMNEGSLRTDINLSVRKKGTNDMNTRVEIKNLNSLSNVQKAIEYESNYQIECYLNNKPILQQTKRFDEATQKTVVMRTKSNVIDYKYFPGINIAYIFLTDKVINDINIEELPYDKEIRYEKLGLNNVQIPQLLGNIEYALYLDKINYFDFKKSANIFFSEIVTYLNNNKIEIKEFNLRPDEVKMIITYLSEGKIIKSSIQKIIDLKQLNKNETLDSLILKNNLLEEQKQISVDEIIDQILKDNPTLINEFKNNYDRAIKFMLGQFMKATQGKGDKIKFQKAIEEKIK
ncbi:Asp-tRNA(Asn)/Glu-tRNA(Gln) amidotransferase subunit GatB [Metamycoplasma buccale]|uniref:Asp-tRNA(Asn)/Glu-tRNA(Gln) amidotransferase subunit GatB n=1 Tax=Metamycoplasma buccale TaxID=55602 RepID=UPI00398F7326